MRSSSAVVALCVLAGTARAQDEFEIQVYDTETAHQGESGLEVHLNHHLIHDAPDESHATLEPHYGLTEWCELGGYLQSSLTTTGDLELAGAKLRVKMRLARWDSGLGIGVNVELSAIPSRFEPQVYGSEVRPIIDYRAGRVYASVNPIFTVDLAGSEAGHPQAEPSVKLAGVVNEHLMVGVEAYGGFGPVDALGDEHVLRAFGVVDVRTRSFDLNAGIGVNDGSPDHPIVKLILGIHP